MTTVTIDNPQIEQKYSAYEIQLKFLYFLEKELKENQVELYQISINDIPKETRAKLDTVNTLNFVDY
ncbi:MAG: hypothetical protein PHN60_02560 [Candidatus Gracilibacteria bacterium]|nr:hypothetical protein [Candidatus Gracilibacteria bacterium]